MVDCKEAEHLEELDMDDSRDLMQPETSKWTRIAAKVNAAGNGPCHRDGAACKYKWQTLLSDYKKIADFHSGIGVNEEEYWGLNFIERKSLGLPRSFYDEVHHWMHGWLRHRATMNPPHVQDLLNVQNRNHVDLKSQDGGYIAGANASFAIDADIYENEVMASEGSEPAPENMYGMSSESEAMCWGSGAWTNRGRAYSTVAAQSPMSPPATMAGMDLNCPPQGASPLLHMCGTSRSPVRGPPSMARATLHMTTPRPEAAHRQHRYLHPYVMERQQQCHVCLGKPRQLVPGGA
jgi:hypothetical protein